MTRDDLAAWLMGGVLLVALGIAVVVALAIMPEHPWDRLP